MDVGQCVRGGAMVLGSMRGRGADVSGYRGTFKRCLPKVYPNVSVETNYLFLCVLLINY